MKSAHKKKLAQILLGLLVKRGLRTCGFPDVPPMMVDDLQETQKLLERLGYEFIIRRRNGSPKDTHKKVYLKMLWSRPRTAAPWPEKVIWICLDADVAMKALVLGFLPEPDSLKKFPSAR